MRNLKNWDQHIYSRTSQFLKKVSILGPKVISKKIKSNNMNLYRSKWVNLLLNLQLALLTFGILFSKLLNHP